MTLSTEELDMVGCMDADKWAKYICKHNSVLDVDTMRASFAVAIMAGFDQGYDRGFMTRENLDKDAK